MGNALRPLLPRFFLCLLPVMTHADADPIENAMDKAATKVPSGARTLFEGDFRQAWRETEEPGFEPARARLLADESGFHVVAALRDASIGNRATGFNEKTWQLGDVFEIFLQTNPGTYYEFHVTPENRNLFLRWTPELFEAFGSGESRFERALVDDPGFLRSETWIDRERGIWTVHARIPFPSLGFDPAKDADHLRFAFARYDTTPGREDPVLSATPPFRRASYHDREFWHRPDRTH